MQANNDSLFMNYRPLVSEVGRRVSNQYLDKRPLSIDTAVEGFNLNDGERTIMTDFAQQVYDGVRLETEAENAYWELATPHKKKSAIPILSGGLGVGLITYAISKDGQASAIAGTIASLIGMKLEMKYRYFTSLFAGVKRRKLGDAFNPLREGEETIKLLEDLTEHSDDYVHETLTALILNQ